MAYTYDQFNSALKQSGLGGSFSQADLNLAKRNPNAGMSLLNYKRDYAAATTDEARKRANSGAENIRSTYGGYTGGTDGSSYYLSNPTPSSFNYATAAPTFDYDKQSPTWKDAYKKAFNAALNEISNYKDFSYDAATDPLYGSYSKAYTREGQRATQDTLGQVSAQTGGLPSSYAVNAAAQAGNYYAAQMADKIPELQQQAYDQYLNDFSIRQAQLTAAGSARDSDYLRYLDEWTQYNTDRNFAYGQYQDQLAQYNNDRDFAYGQHLNQIDYNTQQRNESLQLAEWIYNTTGDASGYAALGVTPEQIALLNAAGAANQQSLQTQRDYDTAALQQLIMQNLRLPTEYAQQDAAYRGNLGDYSGYEALGINTTQLTEQQKYENALRAAALDEFVRGEADWKAGYGDYSGLSALGVDTSQLMTERQYNNTMMAAELDKLVNPAYSSTYEPRLTAAQTLSALESGIAGDEVMQAFEYYYGAGATYTPTTAAYRPTLTLEQTLDAVDSGVMSDEINRAYQYYYGQDIPGYSAKNSAGFGGVTNESNGDYMKIEGRGFVRIDALVDMIDRGEVREVANADGTVTYVSTRSGQTSGIPKSVSGAAISVRQ